jgi:predicted transcriptional regulator
MTDTRTITVRTSHDLTQQINALAKATERSRNWIVEDALKQYVAAQAWQVEGIKAAQASLDAGEAISHEQVMAELDELVAETLQKNELEP